MSRILVIGDSCKDIFTYCDSHRLCPDVPVPVLNVIGHHENMGMALNVRANIEALGQSCDVVTNKNWHLVTKTRYIHATSNHAFFRVDSGVAPDHIGEIPNLKYDMVVVSDYDKGFLKREDIEHICSTHSNVFVDTKKRVGPWLDRARYIKINASEYRTSKDAITESLMEKVIVTLGRFGCEHRGRIYPVQEVGVMDVSGAGDTFLAGLCTNYMMTGDIEQAITFANRCASSVVKHRGVSVVNPHEI
jgi:bifunctional ADP-heptose synthase (sugar kinase/adenylyltransferase)